MSNLKKDLKALFFDVYKEPAPDKDRFYAPHITHQIVAATPKGPLVVNACSKNYGLITNKELMTPLIELLEKSYEVEAHASNWGFSKFYVDFVIKDIEIKIQKRDKIFPRIRMNNSYDGSVRYQFEFGFWRQVCGNGLCVLLDELENGSIKMRHTPGNSKDAAIKTMAAIEGFIREVPRLTKGYHDLIEHEMDKDDAIEMINLVIDEVKRFPRKKEEEVMDRMDKEINMGLPINAFMVYNALNYVLYKTDSQMKPHKRDKVDLEILEFITLNI